MITTEERKYLIDSMCKLLSEYDYKYTEEALIKIIDKWAEEKAHFINAFKKHPNYVDGEFMIVLTKDYERLANDKGARYFSRWLMDYAVPNVNLLPQDIDERRESECCAYLPDKLYKFLRALHNYAERCVSEATVDYLKEVIPEVRVHVGEKTSRVVNKICTYLNYDKVNGYNREFAKYADSLSPMVIKRYVVLSINPLDYLTMSFGNSWSSCHTIDTKNKRDMPNSYQGAYSSGTISYMLDVPSMVLYTVDNSYKGDEYWSQPKINRQMFHYAEEKLVQGRLYPQDNDDCSDQYTFYRDIVQNIVSDIFGFPNLWTFKSGIDDIGKYANSLGTHYRDYYNFENCTISRIKGSENENKFIIGSKPICIRCCAEHEDASHIDHCVIAYCKTCGRAMDEADAIIIDGHAYCRRHAHWCNCCSRYHTGASTYIEDEGIHVCNDCLNEHYVACEMCHEYIRKDKVHEKDGKKVCHRCKERKVRNYHTWNFEKTLNSYERIFRSRFTEEELRRITSLYVSNDN